VLLLLLVGMLLPVVVGMLLPLVVVGMLLPLLVGMLRLCACVLSAAPGGGARASRLACSMPSMRLCSSAVCPVIDSKWRCTLSTMA
jgi:hypothetical protein